MVWQGSTTDGHAVYAAADSPAVATAPAWVVIDGVVKSVITATQLLYVTDTSAGVKACSKPLSNLAATAACTTVVGGTSALYVNSFDNFGTSSVISVADEATQKVTSYLWNGTTSVTVQVPAGSYLDQPTDVGYRAIFGDTPYLLLRNANTVPSVVKVNADGSLGTGFALPTKASAAVTNLVAAPGRVVGTDDRDGSSWLYPAWSRTVSGSGFSAETLLPKRASGVAASAGRTVVSSSDGLSMYDRGTLKYTFADAHLGEVSGPYVTQHFWDPSYNPYVLVSTADGTKVTTIAGSQGMLFGSLYAIVSSDDVPSGQTHLTLYDLTGKAATRVVNLAPGSAGCTNFSWWNDVVGASCDLGHTVRTYSLADGSLLGSQGSATGPYMQLTELGDGYAIVYKSGEALIWKLAANELVTLSECLGWTVSDGVGHVACGGATDLIWRDYSTLSTSPGRVLGWLAPSTMAADATSWTPEIDVSKPFNAGTLTIKQGATVVRQLAVPASVDGSVRGVTWDGKNASGVVMSSGTFSVELAVDSADGSGAVKAVDGLSVPTFQVSRTLAGSFVALSPSRLLDTRDGTGAGPGAVGPGGVVDVQVTGRGGVPSSGVGAVILNVTAVTPSGSGYLTVFPTGGAVPNASNLNFTAGQVVPNLVVAKVGAGGKVSIRATSPGSTHVVADVAGYFRDGAVTDPGGLAALSPSRLVDTRSSGAVPGNGSVRVQAAGVGGVPSTGVAAVVVNITAVTPSATGFLTAFPTGGAAPNASNVNFTAGQVVPNLAFVKLGADGSFTVRNASLGSTHVVADVAGYVLDGSVAGPGMFVALSPARVLDTRPAYGGAGALGANSARVVTMAGAGGVPAANVSGVVMNVTAVASGSGFLTVYPADVGAPNASNVNFTAGQVVPNLVAVKTSSGGAVAIRNGSPGATNVIADVAGYFTA